MFLVLLLLLSNVATLLGAIWMIEQMQREYSKLIKPATEQLGAIQSLALTSAQLHRQSLALLLAEDPEQRSEDLLGHIQAQKDNEQAAATLDRLLRDSELDVAAKRLEHAWHDYRANGELFRQHIDRAQIADAVIVRKTALRGAFNRYHAEQRNVTQELQHAVLNQGHELARRVNVHRSALLAVGGWPLGLIAAGLIGLCYFGFTLARIFRCLLEASEMP